MNGVGLCRGFAAHQHCSNEQKVQMIWRKSYADVIYDICNKVKSLCGSIVRAQTLHPELHFRRVLLLCIVKLW